MNPKNKNNEYPVFNPTALYTLTLALAGHRIVLLYVKATLDMYYAGTFYIKVHGVFLASIYH